MTTRPMAGFDSLMWGLEPMPRMRSWIVAAMVLDGPVDTADLRERLVRVADAVPRLRSTVAPSPRPLAARRWVEREALDPDTVLRHASVSDSPGGLAGLMAATADEPYVPGSPVWRVTVVDGLPDGRTALVMLLHHSVTDGVGAIVMAGLFFDADAHGTRLMEHVPEGLVPEDAGRSGRSGRSGSGGTGAATDQGRLDQAVASLQEDAATALRLGRRAVSSVPSALAGVLRGPLVTVAGAGAYAASLARLMVPAPSPLSPVMREHSARTAAALLDYPVADLKAAGRRYGASLNDVYLAGVLAGLRRYHERIGVPAPESLRIYVPVSTRPADGGGSDQLGGNQFTPLRVELSLAGDTPADLVAGVRQRLAEGRAEPAIGAGALVTEVMGRLPGAVAGQVVSGMFYGLDAVVTNVPGPPVPLWVAGRGVEAMYALAPRSGASMATTLLSFAGTAYVTVNYDIGAVTDPDLMTVCLAEGMRWVL